MFNCIYIQILSHLFVITTSNKDLGSLTYLFKAIMEICCMNHGKYMIMKDMPLQPLMHIGGNACKCRMNLYYIFLHCD